MNKDNVMLVDVQYVRPNRANQTPDYLYMIWKDLLTGEKKLTTIPQPTVDIYFEKPELRNHRFVKRYEYLKNLEKRTVKYTNIIQEIANEMGQKGRDQLRNIYESHDYARLKDFQTYPYVFGSDFDIRTLYRHEWLTKLDNTTPKPISKGFLDIEADSFNIDGFADANTCPIDLVTVIDKGNMRSYTFALVDQQFKPRDQRILSIKEIEKDRERMRWYQQRHIQEQELMNDIPRLKKDLKALFREHYGDIDFNFYFYNDERKLLVHLFQLINQLKLDFIVIWNMSFDIPYILKRMEVLGLDPKEVICHPDFPVKECYFKKDHKNQLPKNKSDFFFCSSYTVFYDQMTLYAAIRKSQKELRSVKLTDVAHDEIRDEKLDYSEDGNIKMLPYVNYRKYIIYNIKDVLLQLGIENRTYDLDTLYVSSYKNATPYEHVFKQTLKLRGKQYISYFSQGIVPGNNINIFNLNKNADVLDEENEDEDSKFEGALVGNPILNDNFGMDLYGKPSNAIFNYSIDMDMSSFYPNTIIAMNIEPSTMYFKCICDADQFKPLGGELEFNGITDKQVVPTNSNSFEGDISKEIFDNFQTNNWISTAHKWNNLPGISDLYEACVDELGMPEELKLVV